MFNKERHWIYISFYFGRIWKVVIKVNLGWHVLLRIGTVLTIEVTEVADKKKKTIKSKYNVQITIKIPAFDWIERIVTVIT